ncbi:hypothetical protein SESBI_00184 [Sesbania bispinosa]|nr:hypothetical protein SESBI_00184 [Sesbania bispinosa]
METNGEQVVSTAVDQPNPKPAAEVQTEGVAFGPWIIVQKNSRRNPKNVGGNSGVKLAGSKCSALQVDNDVDLEEIDAEIQVAPDPNVRKIQSDGPKTKKGKEAAIIGEHKGMGEVNSGTVMEDWVMRPKGRWMKRVIQDEGDGGGDRWNHNHEGTSGSLQNTVQGAVKILQRENVVVVGDQGLVSISNVNHHNGMGNTGPNNPSRGKRYKNQPSGVVGPDQNKAKVGLNLKSQVKFKSIKSAARRGITLPELPISSNGLGAEEGRLVFNTRPPDIV